MTAAAQHYAPPKNPDYVAPVPDQKVTVGAGTAFKIGIFAALGAMCVALPFYLIVLVVGTAH